MHVFKRSYLSVIVCVVRTFTFSFILSSFSSAFQIAAKSVLSICECVCVCVMCCYCFFFLFYAQMFFFLLLLMHICVTRRHIVHCTSLAILMNDTMYILAFFTAVAYVIFRFISLCFVPICNTTYLNQLVAGQWCTIYTVHYYYLCVSYFYLFAQIICCLCPHYIHALYSYMYLYNALDDTININRMIATVHRLNVSLLFHFMSNTQPYVE